MQTINFIIGGLGGQGILFLTKILAKTALQKGFNVMGAETHGMAQRGGSVISHLRLGDVESSLVKPGSATFYWRWKKMKPTETCPFWQKAACCAAAGRPRRFPIQASKAT